MKLALGLTQAAELIKFGANLWSHLLKSTGMDNLSASMYVLVRITLSTNRYILLETFIYTYLDIYTYRPIYI